MGEFRFRISERVQEGETEREEVSFSEWATEIKVHGQHSNAVDAIEEVRKEYPDAALSIERRGTQPKPTEIAEQ